MFGIILAVLGTLLPIGVSLFLHSDPVAMAGLLATVWVAISLLDPRREVSPALGLVIFIICLFIAGAVYYIGNIALWGLLAPVFIVIFLKL